MQESLKFQIDSAFIHRLLLNVTTNHYYPLFHVADTEMQANVHAMQLHTDLQRKS